MQPPGKTVQVGVERPRVCFEHKLQDPAGTASHLGAVFQGDFHKGRDQVRVPQDVIGHLLSPLPGGVHVIQLIL